MRKTAAVVANVDKDLNYTVPFGEWTEIGLGVCRGRALEWNGTDRLTLTQTLQIAFLSALPDDNCNGLFLGTTQRDDFTITLGRQELLLWITVPG